MPTDDSLWLSIPQFAEPGSPHAYADRESQLAALYRSLVEAGNQVRRGRIGVHIKHAVHGYVGVGKSALILQALAMIRGELSREGQRVALPESLLEPIDPQRWLILRLSGKRIADIPSLKDSIRDAIAESTDDASPESPGRNPLFRLVEDIVEAAEQQMPAALQLPLVARLLRSERKLYGAVRDALAALAQTLDVVERWYGATVKEQSSAESHQETASDLKARIDGLIKGNGRFGDSAKSQAALEAAAGILSRRGESWRNAVSMERRWQVDADIVTDALNNFFAATDRAQLPTILVLDDFDELASSVGSEYARRARILRLLLGSFNALRPTCLVIALRDEYMHEDVRRQYQPTHIPSMTALAGGRALEAWAEVQQPNLTAEQVQRLKQHGRSLVAAFADAEPVVVPQEYLQAVVWLANRERSGDHADDLRAYVTERFNPVVVGALTRLAANFDADGDDAKACAAGHVLDLTGFGLSERERKALKKDGLLRPASAGEDDDVLGMVSPLAAYLWVARQ